jgi:hypothetical protein
VFREIVHIYCENNTEGLKALCRQNAVNYSVVAVGIPNRHRPEQLKVSVLENVWDEVI